MSERNGFMRRETAKSLHTFRYGLPILLLCLMLFNFITGTATWMKMAILLHMQAKEERRHNSPEVYKALVIILAVILHYHSKEARI